MEEKNKINVLDIINKWKNLSLEIVSLREKEISLIETLGKMKAGIIFEISIEKDDNGKTKFKNETMREAELYKRLDKDAEYQLKKAELQNMIARRKKTEIEAVATEYTIKALLNDKTPIRDTGKLESKEARI